MGKPRKFYEDESALFLFFALIVGFSFKLIVFYLCVVHTCQRYLEGTNYSTYSYFTYTFTPHTDWLTSHLMFKPDSNLSFSRFLSLSLTLSL